VSQTRQPRPKHQDRLPPPATSAAVPRANLRSVALPAVLIAVAVLLVYTPAMRGGYLWDDARYVSENPVLRNADGLSDIWTDLGATVQYYPMVFTTFWIEYHLWQLDTLGYHLVNIVLHVLTAVLLGCILRRLAVPGAWLAAAVFALHPLQVESVAWITERKNVLAGAFYMASALSYLHFDPGMVTANDERRRWRFWAFAGVFFLGALFSKTVACSLPAALLLVAWWKRGRLTRRVVLPLLPLFAAGAVMARVTTWVEANNVRAVGRDWDLSFLERILIAGRALWFYIAKLILPLKLTFNYPRWEIDTGAWWQYVYPLAAVALVVALWRWRGRLGRGPLVAALFYGGTLLPALGFTDVYPMRYSFVADHFQYLAGIGPIVLACVYLARRLGGAGEATSRSHPRRQQAAPTGSFYALAGAILVVLAFLTVQQARIYKNWTTLWQDTLAKNPSSFLAHNNLGSTFIDSGQLDFAIKSFGNAVRIKSDFYEAQSNLGRALAAKGRLEEAETHSTEAVRLKPDSPEANYNLANVLAGRGKLAEALGYYEASLRLRPSQAIVQTNLANTLAQLGRFEEAVVQYREAIRLAPGDATSWANLGRAFLASGADGEAAEAFQQALRLAPRDASTHVNLGLVLEKRGDRAAAAKEYEAALRINPGLVAARRALDGLDADKDASPDQD
jgi:protein O-mannosyl-transferase